MNTKTTTFDALVGDKKIAHDWVAALRHVDPAIDQKVDTCLARLRGVRSYLPAEQNIWRAYETPLADVRVLILGQDPYPNPDHAVGLSFSTGPNGPIPDSLANIYAELRAGGYRAPEHGDLSPWSQRGVMLLNRALTLPRDPEARPRRHLRWWAPVIRATVKAIAVEAETRPIAAMLWGVPAHRLRAHLGRDVEVFASSHPAPQGVARTAGGEEPFRSSSPFVKVNDWFRHRDSPEIDWNLGD
jgi:uracil-DNA glycosylase